MSEDSDDGKDTEVGKTDKSASESRVGGQIILETQPEINMKVPANHFDFGAILPLLSNLEEIYMCYKVSGGQLNNNINIMKFSKFCTKIRILTLNSSRCSYP